MKQPDAKGGAVTDHDALLNQIYGTVADPACWSNTLVSISDYLGCIGGQLIYNAPPGRKGLMVLGRLDSHYTEVYYKYHVWNPWTLAAREQPFDRPVIAGSVVDRCIIQRTSFYADVLAPQKIEDMVIINHRGMARDGGVGGIGFALSASKADRAEQIGKQLNRLAPHLCRALDATLRLGPMVDGSRQLAKVLQQMPNPALLLDARGRVVHANPAAELLLRDGSGLACVADKDMQLTAAQPGESAALAHAVARALRVAGGSSDELGEPLQLTRSSGSAPLFIVPVPLPPPAFSLWELSESARVLVLILDPTMRHVAAAPALQSTFGLTNAEARVAALVGSGLSGPQAAQTIGISPATVKTHLARCFEKMGIRSQVELARILSALPVDHTIVNQQAKDSTVV